MARIEMNDSAKAAVLIDHEKTDVDGNLIDDL